MTVSYQMKLGLKLEAKSRRNSAIKIRVQGLSTDGAKTNWIMNFDEPETTLHLGKALIAKLMKHPPYHVFKKKILTKYFQCR